MTYNPNEPRDWHGRWTRGGSAGKASAQSRVNFLQQVGAVQWATITGHGELKKFNKDYRDWLNRVRHLTLRGARVLAQMKFKKPDNNFGEGLPSVSELPEENPRGIVLPAPKGTRTYRYSKGETVSQRYFQGFSPMKWRLNLSSGYYTVSLGGMKLCNENGETMRFPAESVAKAVVKALEGYSGRHPEFFTTAPEDPRRSGAVVFPDFDKVVGKKYRDAIVSGERIDVPRCDSPLFNATPEYFSRPNFGKHSWNSHTSVVRYFSRAFPVPGSAYKQNRSIVEVIRMNGWNCDAKHTAYTIFGKALERDGSHYFPSRNLTGLVRFGGRVVCHPITHLPIRASNTSLTDAINTYKGPHPVLTVCDVWGHNDHTTFRGIEFQGDDFLDKLKQLEERGDIAYEEGCLHIEAALDSSPQRNVPAQRWRGNYTVARDGIQRIRRDRITNDRIIEPVADHVEDVKAARAAAAAKSAVGPGERISIPPVLTPPPVKSAGEKIQTSDKFHSKWGLVLNASLSDPSVMRSFLEKVFDPAEFGFDDSFPKVPEFNGDTIPEVFSRINTVMQNSVAIYRAAQSSAGVDMSEVEQRLAQYSTLYTAMRRAKESHEAITGQKGNPPEIVIRNVVFGVLAQLGDRKDPESHSDARLWHEIKKEANL